jgi:uncharacterized membrane protein YhaH (DUF805 family)
MTFQESVTVCFRKYTEFDGRAGRSEYWWFTLAVWLVTLVLGLLTLSGVDFDTEEFSGIGLIGTGLMLVFWLAIIVPSIAVMVRRFHDRDMSGWWVLGFVLLSMLPFVGFIASIAQLVIFCLKGSQGDNRYGADPLMGAANPEVFS